MTNIHLMDINGLPRLVLNQPAPVTDPSERDAWLAAFSAVCSLPEGREISVKYRTGGGRTVKALLVNREPIMEIHPGGDITLFMYARDIIPESCFVKL